MADHQVSGGRVRCQAHPAAVRHGWRKDLLCASYANTAVTFRGIEVPVCRIHEATFIRWGDHADANAEKFWAWRPNGAVAHAD